MRIDNFYLSNEVKKPWLRPNIDPHKWYTDNIFLGVKRSWLQLKIFLVKNHFWGKVYWIFVELWCFSLLWMSSWLKRYYFSKPLGLDQYCEHCFFLKRGWWTCSEGALNGTSADFLADSRVLKSNLMDSILIVNVN